MPPSAAFSKKGEPFSPQAIWEAGSRVLFCKTRPSTMQCSRSTMALGAEEKSGEKEKRKQVLAWPWWQVT